MIVARTSHGWSGVRAVALFAVTGLACGGSGGSGTPGSGGATGSAGTSGAAGTSGSAGTSGGSAGASGGAGTSGGSAGGGGSAGASSGPGSGGSVGASGGPGTGGSAGSSGSSGTSGGRGGAAGGRGGTTGTAGATGTAGSMGTGGRGGATGSGGSGGAAGGATPSAGCNSAGDAPASGHYTIDVSGTAREYIIKIPASYDAKHPYRLIFAFHGRMYDAASVDSGAAPSKEGAYYGIEPMSGGGAIFVAPQALSTSWLNANDIPYVNAMIARFESQLCIDQSRIFATGFSMGAIQTIALGCGEGEVFRAIAPMSGEIMGSCGGTTPVAYWGSHGTNDPTIAIADGRAARETFRLRNHCSTETVAGSISGCVAYQGCDPGKPVTWCEFTGVHEPPPFSGEGIWGFFSQF